MADRFIAPDVSPEEIGLSGAALAKSEQPESTSTKSPEDAESPAPEPGSPGEKQPKPAERAPKPELPVDLAASREDVLNQFPFAGTVFRREEGEWAFLDHVPAKDPVRLGAFKLRSDVTPGEYRVVTAKGRSDIRFRIAGAEELREEEPPQSIVARPVALLLAPARARQDRASHAGNASRSASAGAHSTRHCPTKGPYQSAEQQTAN